MVDADAVRRIAAALPDITVDGDDGLLRLEIGGKGVAWTYLARDAPKRPRRPHPDVLAVRCALEEKEILIEVAPQTYFDDDHYRGYPAVLVRLAAIAPEDLAARLRRACDLVAASRSRRR